MSGASRIEVERVDGRCRLVSCRSVAPLKIVSPRTGGDYCAAVLSGYGGGVVEGDRVELEVRCGAGAALFVGTQSYTKVYKNPRGQVSRQVIRGQIAAGGVAVALPDPVVPYAGSRFVQEQEWDLEAGALLVLADGHTAGRGAYGERFDYTAYASHIEVRQEGRPTLVERYESEPKKGRPERAGAFGEYRAVLNVFVLGDAGDDRRQRLVEALEAEVGVLGREGLLVSYGTARQGVTVLRAVGQDAAAVEVVVGAVGRAVGRPEVLGEDPLRRKF